MRPFKLIQGNNTNISKFEDEVAKAIEEGYEFNGEMIVKTIPHANKPTEVLFFQPMTMEEHLDFEDDFEDHDEESEESDA